MKRMSSSLRAKEEFMVLCREGMYQAGERLPSETKMAQNSESAAKHGVLRWSCSGERALSTPNTAWEPSSWRCPPRQKMI